MYSTKQLSGEQITAIQSWAAGGAQLPDIQLRMKEDFGFSLTYMDTRFLVLDLGIEIIVEKMEEPAAEIKQAPITTGAVSVTMDAIAVPGAIVSGKVVFSDGEAGIWMLDQTGRLGLNPSKPGYRPSETDIMSFQRELQRVAQGLG